MLPTGGTVAVKVCDEHAEDITPKIAREKYMAKLSDVESLIKMAKAMGLEINIPSSKDKIAIASQNQPAPTQQPTQVPAQPNPASKLILPQGKPLSPTTPVDLSEAVDLTVLDKPANSIEGTARSEVLGSVSVSRLPSYNIGLQKPRDEQEAREATMIQEARSKGTAVIEVVEGRGGKPIKLPTSRSDGLGHSTVKVSKAIDDAKLQQYFKETADASKSDRAPSPDFRHGYDDRPCPLCRGTGQIKQKTNGVVGMMECPKCGGAGTLL